MDDTLRFRIARPCNANWAEMKGDERARFCANCRKHVYNLSAMKPAEIRELVKEKEGKFCARLYQRRDGTVLTADCPVGLRAARRAAAAGLVFVIAVLFLPLIAVASPSGVPSTFSVMQTLKRVPVIGALIRAIEPEPPRHVMGEFAPP